MKLSDIARQLDAKIVGDGEVDIVRINTIENAVSGDLTFLANPKYASYLKSTNTSTMILSEQPAESVQPCILIHADPHFAISKALTLFFPAPGNDLPAGIAATAVVAADAVIGAGVHIGNFVEISSGATVGENSKIMSGCYLGKECRIGRNTLIYPNVTIYDRCIIGDNVIIHAGTVIGSDGFGFATHQGKHHKVYQVGIVRIENDVEIGSNCSVDRAALGETMIGEGTKIDNLVQIAHNVKIGKHCLIVAQVGISGSTKLGDYVTLAGQVGLVGHIEIGDRTIVAAQAGVPKSLKPDMIYAGSPAREFGEFKRLEAHLRRLPKLVEQIKRLETEIAELKKNS